MSRSQQYTEVLAVFLPSKITIEGAEHSHQRRYRQHCYKYNKLAFRSHQAASWTGGSSHIHKGLDSEQGGICGASDGQAEALALLIQEHHIGCEAGGLAASKAHGDWQLLLGNAYQAALWEVKGKGQVLLIWRWPNLSVHPEIILSCV